MHIRRTAIGILASMLVLAAAGCTKLVPASINDFGAEKTVVVTLRDGETIKGHLARGEHVTFTTFGRVYRATVEEADETGIVLSKPYIQEEYERYRIQRERMEGAALHIRDETERITIPAYKIVKVDEVTIDKMKSARAGGFWGFTVFVLAKIMSARL